MSNQNSHPPADGELTLEIVETVAAANGVPHTSLPPLANVINPEAVEALFKNRPQTGAVIEFKYAGQHVLVAGGGQVSLATPEEDP